MRYPLRFEGKFGKFVRIFGGVRPETAYVDVGPAHIELRCGWGLSARIPRQAVRTAEVVPWPRKWKIGWQLAPENRVYAIGAKVPCALLVFDPPQPVRMPPVSWFGRKASSLTVSVEDPEGLVAEIRGVDRHAAIFGR